MKKFAAGFVMGGAVCAVVLVPVLLAERASKFNFGRHHGQIDGRREAAEALGREFGQYDGRSPYKVLFSVKTIEVISVETNGIKTVRIIP
jgi:hypothetical protein